MAEMKWLWHGSGCGELVTEEICSNYRLKEVTLLWVSSGDRELMATISWLYSTESEEKWV